MAMINLSAPWIIFYRKVEALFRNDPDVHVVFDNATNELTLFVDEPFKAAAIQNLMPTSKTFGDVVMRIQILVDNEEVYAELDPDENIYETAFNDNPALSFVKEVYDIFGNKLTYVVFVPEVVHFWTDDLSDMYGMQHTLYQEIAKEVLEPAPGVFFNTDVERSKVLGVTKPCNWP